MRKHYLLVLACVCAFWGCAKPVDDSEIELNSDGLFCLIGSDKLYTGKFVSYYDNGKIQRKLTFKDGMPNGAFKEYHENGQLAEKGTMIGFMKDGAYESYDENGKLKEKGTYNINNFLK